MAGYASYFALKEPYFAAKEPYIAAQAPGEIFKSQPTARMYRYNDSRAESEEYDFMEMRVISK